MACYWIDLIPLRCSGNQATISLEALVLMTNLVDLMVGSIQLGLVGTREEERSVLIHLSDLTNLLKQSVEPEATAVSSLLLDPQAYYSQHYSPQSASQSTGSQHIGLQAYVRLQAYI